MITIEQKIKLRRLIEEYHEAILEAAFAGSQSPDEAQDLRITEVEARARVMRYINLIAKSPDVVPLNPEVAKLPSDMLSKSEIMQLAAQDRGISVVNVPLAPFSSADFKGFPQHEGRKEHGINVVDAPLAPFSSADFKGFPQPEGRKEPKGE